MLRINLFLNRRRNIALATTLSLTTPSPWITTQFHHRGRGGTLFSSLFSSPRENESGNSFRDKEKKEWRKRSEKSKVIKKKKKEERRENKTEPSCILKREGKRKEIPKSMHVVIACPPICAPRHANQPYFVRLSSSSGGISLCPFQIITLNFISPLYLFLSPVSICLKKTHQTNRRKCRKRWRSLFFLTIKRNCGNSSRRG